MGTTKVEIVSSGVERKKPNGITVRVIKLPASDNASANEGSKNRDKDLMQNHEYSGSVFIHKVD